MHTYIHSGVIVGTYLGVENRGYRVFGVSQKYMGKKTQMSKKDVCVLCVWAYVIEADNLKKKLNSRYRITALYIIYLTLFHITSFFQLLHFKGPSSSSIKLEKVL